YTQIAQDLRSVSNGDEPGIEAVRAVQATALAGAAAIDQTHLIELENEATRQQRVLLGLLARYRKHAALADAFAAISAETELRELADLRAQREEEMAGVDARRAEVDAEIADLEDEAAALRARAAESRTRAAELRMEADASGAQRAAELSPRIAELTREAD